MAGPEGRVARLKVMDEAEPYMWRGRVSHRQWHCVCDCGAESVVRNDRLTSLRTRSCGCLRAETMRRMATRHGCRTAEATAPEYNVWRRLRRASGDFPVSRRWLAPDGGGFAAFLADMGPRPSPQHRLIRVREDRGFTRGNCIWQFAAPRRGVPRRLIRYRGRDVTLSRAAELSGIAYRTLCKRLERGWEPERALRA